MSCLRLGKKLLPPKKAWKSFTSMLKSKLHHLRHPKKALKKANHRSVAMRSIHPFVPHEHRDLPRHYHHHGQEAQTCLATIYVDKLYEERAGTVHSKRAHPQEETSEAMDIVAQNGAVDGVKAEAGAGTGGMTMEEKEHMFAMETMDDECLSDFVDALDVCASTLPQLHGVDAKAEEFIKNFREHLTLQREKSIEDYYEMLARST